MKNIFFILILSIVVSSCMDDELLWEQNLQNIPLNTADTTHGVFIVNEGNFMYDNASLSFYNAENKQIFNNVFFNTNGLILGDVAISMTIRKNLAYIVLNNSGKIYVFDKNNYSYKGKITGLTSPRYIHFINDTKAYVTDLYAKSIAIINPITLDIIGHININNNNKFYQHSSEQMIKIDDKIFINCWSYDNKILVIDTQNDILKDSIEVPLQPNSMVIDKNKKIWVACDGGFQGSPYGHVASALVKINPQTLETEQTITFAMNDDLKRLQINKTGDTLYFINKHIYRLEINSSVPEIFVRSHYTSTVEGFYGLGIDPINSDIYIADAIDFSRNGNIFRYSAKGIPLDTFSVGMIPSFFYFTKE